MPDPRDFFTDFAAHDVNLMAVSAALGMACVIWIMVAACRGIER